MRTISFDDFEKVDIRVGKIIEIKDFPRARRPSYKMKIDFGDEIGVKQSAGQFKTDYAPAELLDRQCLAVVNFEPRNIAGFMSEVLVLGVPKEESGLSIVRPVDEVRLGSRMY